MPEITHMLSEEPEIFVIGRYLGILPTVAFSPNAYKASLLILV